MIRNAPDQLLTVIAFDKNGRISGDAGNLSCTVKKDNGADAPLTDTTPTERGVTGEYHYQLEASETDGYRLEFSPQSATPGVQVLAAPDNVIYTRTGPSSGGGQSQLTVNFAQPVIVVRGDDVLLRWFNPGSWSGLLETDGYKLGLVGEHGPFEKDGTYNQTDDAVEVPLTKDETASLRGWYDYDLQHIGPTTGVSTLGNGRFYAAETTTDIPADGPLPPGPL